MVVPVMESTEQCVNELNGDVQNKLKENSNWSFMAHAFLRNCDSVKCESLKKNFQMQCALNDNQHLKKVSAVNDMLGSHQWDQAHNEKEKEKGAETGKQTKQ